MFHVQSGSWVRFVAAGCLHGQYANPDAVAAFHEFNDEFDPQYRIFLGDGYDLRAFMSRDLGGGTADALEYDAAVADEFLRRFAPHLFFKGNHEHRVDELVEHKNALVAAAARQIYQKLHSWADRDSVELVPYRIDPAGWRRIGDVILGHGFVTAEQAASAQAKLHGCTTIVAHNHRVTRIPVRKVGDTIYGISVGCLADIPAMDYASRRTATLSWDNGWIYGEFKKEGPWQINEKIVHSKSQGGPAVPKALA